MLHKNEGVKFRKRYATQKMRSNTKRKQKEFLGRYTTGVMVLEISLAKGIEGISCVIFIYNHASSEYQLNF
jgi:hypothetical protein